MWTRGKMIANLARIVGRCSRQDTCSCTRSRRRCRCPRSGTVPRHTRRYLHEQKQPWQFIQNRRHRLAHFQTHKLMHSLQTFAMIQKTAVVVIQEATSLLVSHTVPVYPTKHVQSKASTKSTHVALFWQGSGRHSSMSEK